MDLPLQVVQFIVTGLIAVYVWVESRQRASRDQLDAVRAAHEARLDLLERGQSAVIEKLAHLPTTSELSKLTVAVTELRGEVRGSLATMRERVDSGHHRISRVEAFLDSTSKRKAAVAQ